MRPFPALQFGHGCEPWKTGREATPGVARQGFNSATAVSRGKLMRTILSWVLRESFNSATAVSRGKLEARQPQVNASERLQFGHGCEPWKTGRRRSEWCETVGFNSATAVSRGKRARRPRSSSSRTGFNSATAVSRGKPVGFQREKPLHSGFNSATAVSRGKHRVHHPATRPGTNASIRPRL